MRANISSALLAALIGLVNSASADYCLELELRPGQTVSGQYWTHPDCRLIPYPRFLASFAKENGIDNTDQAYRRLRHGIYRFPTQAPAIPALLEETNEAVTKADDTAEAPLDETVLALTEAKMRAEKAETEIILLRQQLTEQIASIKQLTDEKTLLQRRVEEKAKKLEIIAQNTPPVAAFNHPDDEESAEVLISFFNERSALASVCVLLVFFTVGNVALAIRVKRQNHLLRRLTLSLRQHRSDAKVYRQMAEPFYHPFQLTGMKPSTVYLRYGEILPNGQKTVIIPGINCLVPAENNTIEAMLRFAVAKNRDYPISLPPPIFQEEDDSSAPAVQPSSTAKTTAVERRKRIHRRIALSN